MVEHSGTILELTTSVLGVLRSNMIDQYLLSSALALHAEGHRLKHRRAQRGGPFPYKLMLSFWGAGAACFSMFSGEEWSDSDTCQQPKLGLNAA